MFRSISLQVLSMAFSVGFLSSTSSREAYAQVATQSATKTEVQSNNGKQPVVGLLRYNPQRQGPLLFIPNGYWTSEYDATPPRFAKEIAEGRTPAQFAEQTKRRVVTEGNVNAIVPQTMVEITKNPGKPDPYAGMPFEDRFRILLSTLSREQWKQAGSANGIGFSDLKDDQHSIFGGIWRDDSVPVQAIITSPEGISHYSEDDPVAVSDLRFRLSRSVSLRLKHIGEGSDYTYHPEYDGATSKPDQEADMPPVHYFLKTRDQFNSIDGDGQGVVSAFGVPILKTVANRLKTGHLDLDSPAVNTSIRMDGSHKTLGELLSAVSKATRIRLVADKRIALLPVQYRIAPGGQVASTGDILKVLCRSVTGTFRKLDSPNGETVYLLTDDVEGIGTRFARLERWATKAFYKTMNASEKAMDDIAANEPLDALGFAPGDPYALPPELLKRVDDSYRTQTTYESPSFPVNQLPAALQQEVRDGAELFRKNSGADLRTDTVGVDTEFRCDWLLPGGRSAPALSDGALSLGFVRSVAVPPSARSARNAKAYKHPSPTKFPVALKRRILTAPLPATEAESVELFSLTARKGFTEIWLNAEDATPKTREQLRQAIARGKTVKVRVGMVIPWLVKEGVGVEATPDVNILNETGAVLAEANLRMIDDSAIRDRVRSEYKDRYAGWVVPDAANARGSARSIVPFMKIPDLAAVLFTNPAAVGYEKREKYRVSYPSTSHMGYTPIMRFQCVLEKGFDPVDVAFPPYSLHTSSNLPFFRQPEHELGDAMVPLRQARNEAYLARVHATLREMFPKQRFLLDDNAHSTFGFFGYWENPSGFPEIGERDAIDPKRFRNTVLRPSASPPIFTLRGEPPAYTSAMFWDSWHNGAEEAAKGWGGFALHMSSFSLTDVTTLLDRLPDDAPSK